MKVVGTMLLFISSIAEPLASHSQHDREGGCSRHGAAHRAAVVTVQPLANARGVEVVHAHRQHPDGLPVRQVRQAHRARLKVNHEGC